MQYTYMYVGMEAYKMALRIQLSDVQCLHSQLWLNDEVLLLDVFNLMMQSLVGVGNKRVHRTCSCRWEQGTEKFNSQR